MSIPKLLQRIADHFPSLTITKDGLAYLTRYYLFLKDRVFGNIFLHHFHRSDMDLGVDGLGLLHNHPFDWSFGFVLSGGYWEERRQEDGTIVRKKVKPFTFNFLSKKHFHRVDLIDETEGAWTLFFTGSRKNNSWGFWDRTTKQFIDWKKVVGAIE